MLAPNAQGVKKTSKLAVFAIIWGVLFVLAQFVDVSGRSWGGLLFATVIPALLSGFAVYVTRPSGKVQGRVLAWVAVGITVVGLVIGGVFVIRDDAKAKLIGGIGSIARHQVRSIFMAGVGYRGAAAAAEIHKG